MSERPSGAVSVLILARNEAENLETLLPVISDLFGREGLAHEVVVVDAASPDGTAEVAARHGARVVRQRLAGYANALRQGFAECEGEYVLTLDADLSHRPEFVADMLDAIREADLVIASRYHSAGSADMPAGRRALSLVLNRVFAVALGLPTRDLSSGFRLYRRRALARLDPRGDYFDVLPEIVALAHFDGQRIREVPFHYHPREAGVSKARVLAFAPSYMRTLARCWLGRLRARRRRAGRA
jgi:glycosyltransferase involved in cell wall biosynthesis